MIKRKVIYWLRLIWLKMRGKTLFYPSRIKGYEHSGHQVLVHKDDGELYWVCVDGCPDPQSEKFGA